MDFSYADISKMIDHALLSPALGVEELDSGIRLARQYDVACVCIMPFYLRRCAELLAGSSVRAGATVGFPHGGHTTASKVAEATEALADGAQELDMVINISKAKSGDWDYVRTEIARVLEVSHAQGQKLKVIFENCFLSDDQKIRLCHICGDLGVDWVKTSTGYGSGGATDEDLVLMRKNSPPHVQVKAAGGVRTFDRLLEVRALSVTRVGASATASILDECKRRLGMATETRTTTGDGTGY